ncbi:acetylcholine receptor subunit alpha-like [Mercenaria mercenaria]|uniref:acetylcholine receptor subunit alpha-like n=1 Tax=Mercenaria mercenaria TaxID=6596 RepID=UPI00234E85A5|nr:acetylcholine receptor subunit alpha-like [Mercenaria mercenaria]
MRKDVLVICILFIRETALTLEYPECKLQNDLFKDYKVDVRPVLDYTKPVRIVLGLALRKILHLDEIRQSFKTTVNVLLYWQDESLKWNKSDYHGISNIEFPFNKNLWTPDLMVYNALDKPGKLGVKNAFVRLYNNGQIFVWTQTNFETACEIRTKRFPFDEQVCEIVISKFISSDEKIEIKPVEKTVNMNEYVEIAEWKIKETIVTTTVDPLDISVFINSNESTANIINYTSITYTLKMQRTCQLCFFNIILPVLILAALNLLTFFVPCESGEKTSFPIAMFLTLAVFLTIITRSLPESIDGVSYLSSFVTFQLTISAIILLCAVVSLQIHYRNKNAPTSKITYFIIKCLGCKRPPVVKIDKPEGDEDNSLEIEHSEMISEKNIRSEDLSYFFDKLMFFLLILCEVISTTIFLALIWF